MRLPSSILALSPISTSEWMLTKCPTRTLSPMRELPSMWQSLGYLALTLDDVPPLFASDRGLMIIGILPRDSASPEVFSHELFEVESLFEILSLVVYSCKRWT